MKQHDYREKYDLTLETFGSRIGKGKSVVHRYEHGQIPDRATMAKIVEATGGEIQPNDYYNDAAADEKAA